MTSTTVGTETSQTLPDALREAGYRGLFLRLGSNDNDRVRQLWEQYGLDGFTAVIADPSADTHARFLAAEVVYHVRAALPETSPPDLLAVAYAAALADNFTGSANPWGLPETLGEVSLHVLELGQAATPHFLPLLDDDTPLSYAGSEEATIGNRYGYRVKDVAAFLLSRVEMASYGVVVDAEERDRRIDALRARLDPR